MANTGYFTEETTLYNVLVILQCILIKVLPALGIIIMNIIIVCKVVQLVNTASRLQSDRNSQLQTIWATQQQMRSSREPSVAQQGETSAGLTHRHSPTFLELPASKPG